MEAAIVNLFLKVQALAQSASDIPGVRHVPRVARKGRTAQGLLQRGVGLSLV